MAEVNIEEWDEFDFPVMYWKPADEQGPACLSIERNTLKRFERVWFFEDGREPSREWGWTLAPNAVRLVLDPKAE